MEDEKNMISRGKRKITEFNIHRKVFVGNVSYRIKSRKLTKFFSKFGAVECCCIVKDHISKRSRGIAFVTFKEEESVQRAIQASEDELFFDQRQMRVKPAELSPKVTYWQNNPLSDDEGESDIDEELGNRNVLDHTTDELDPNSPCLIDKLFDDLLMRIFSLLSWKERIRIERVYAGDGKTLYREVGFTQKHMHFQNIFRQFQAKYCPEIKELDLSSMKLADVSTRNLVSGCTNLCKIKLTRCLHITDKGVNTLLMSGQPLSHLDISDISHLSEKIDDNSIKNLATHSKHLEELYINNCRGLTGISLQHICKTCSHLRVLHATGVKFDTETLEDIKKLKALIICFEVYHLDLGWQTDEPCSHDNDILSISEMTVEGRQSKACLQNYQTQLSTSTNKANVSFTTNADNDAQGFRIFYFADWPCKTNLKKDNGEFASPRWPNTYPAMTSCHWHIRGPKHSNIFLRFTSIELEDHTGSSCRTAYDKIDIYDSNFTTNHITTLCGNRRPDSFTSSGSSLYVVFSSDSRVQAKGFHASYTFIYPTTTTTTSSSTTKTTTTTPTSKLISSLTNASSVKNKTGLPLPTNLTLDRISTENSLFETKYVSLSVKMAMVAAEEDNSDVIKLTAIFVEPIVNDDDDDNEIVNKSVFNDGKTSDDIGRGQNTNINYDIIDTEKDFTAIILGVLAAFILLLLILSISLMLVCRYYRRRLPKIRQGTNIHSPEENLSLCQNNGQNNNQEEFKDENDVDEAARLPLPRDHEPIPDVEFHNPLYKDHSLSDVNTDTRDETNQSYHDASQVDDADDQTSEHNASALCVTSESESESRTGASYIEETTDLCSEIASSPSGDIQSAVYIDCLTTV